MIAVGLLNFLIFVAGATYLGGDAVNGKVEGGRYYLFGVRAESGRKVYTRLANLSLPTAGGMSTVFL